MTLLLLTVPAAAQDARTFGTTDESVHTLSAWAFTGFDAASAARFAADDRADRYCEGGPCFYLAPLMLPQGALIVSAELQACDINGQGGSVTMNLLRRSSSPRALVDEGAVSTHDDFTFCPTFFPIVFNPPLQVDNANNSYFIQVGITGPDDRTKFADVRVFYRLQVSPAPATATFNDVPTTHPFFPFIEALVRAGITTGCDDSPPLFCPDGLVTRK